MGGVGDKGRGGWKPEVARQEKKWAISEIKSESREREKSVSYSDGCKALWAGPMFVQVQPWRLEQPSHNAAYSPLYHAFRPPFILLCFLTPTRLPLSILDIWILSSFTIMHITEELWVHSYTLKFGRGGWRHTAFTVNQIIGQHAMNNSIHAASYKHTEVKISNTGYPVKRKW